MVASLGAPSARLLRPSSTGGLWEDQGHSGAIAPLSGRTMSERADPAQLGVSGALGSVRAGVSYPQVCLCLRMECRPSEGAFHDDEPNGDLWPVTL